MTRHEAARPSVDRHEASPEWFQDAKFGVYCHWDAFTAPVGGVDAAGQSVQFAKKLIVHGGQFDPEEWARTIRASGARFAGPVAEHRDGFSMGDSRVSEWEPRLDLLDLFGKALRGQG